MAKVITTCPITGAPVSTGHLMNQQQLEAATARFAFRCNGCGDIHQFAGKDAWLQEFRGRVR